MLLSFRVSEYLTFISELFLTFSWNSWLVPSTASPSLPSSCGHTNTHKMFYTLCFLSLKVTQKYTLALKWQFSLIWWKVFADIICLLKPSRTQPQNQHQRDVLQHMFHLLTADQQLHELQTEGNDTFLRGRTRKSSSTEPPALVTKSIDLPAGSDVQLNEAGGDWGCVVRNT